LKKLMILSLSLTFLAACSAYRPDMTSMDPCIWVKPIEFNEETKEWLEDQDWPESAYEDFIQIYKHNLKVKELCNE